MSRGWLLSLVYATISSISFMTATGHAVIGAVIAAKIGNPALAIPIAVASHVLADATPHWDTGTNSKTTTKIKFLIGTIIDVCLGFIISFVILKLFFPRTDLFYAFVIIIAAQSLDWLTSPYHFMGAHRPPFSWLHTFQKIFDNRMDKPKGVIYQVAILIALVLAAKLF